jgi:hypothetical protein
VWVVKHGDIRKGVHDIAVTQQPSWGLQSFFALRLVESSGVYDYESCKTPTPTPTPSPLGKMGKKERYKELKDRTRNNRQADAVISPLRECYNAFEIGEGVADVLTVTRGYTGMEAWSGDSSL